MLSQGPFSYNRFNQYDKLHEGAKPDFLDMDKDGDKKEPMKKAIKEKGECKDCGKKDCGCDKKKEVNENRFAAYGGKSTDAGASMAKPSKGIKGGKTYDIKGKDGKPLFKKEEMTVTKDDVIAHLIENNYVNNSVSAEAMFNHISDEYLEEIEAAIVEGYKPLPAAKMANQANKAYDKEQAAVKAGDAAGANKQMQRRIAMKDPAGRKAVIGK